MERRRSRLRAFVGSVGVLLVAALGLWVAGALASGTGHEVLAAPVAAPMQQSVSASGYVTNGQGACLPDAILLDCDGNVVRELKGPGGAGFFAPYLGQWVEVNGPEQTCSMTDTYISVLSIQPVADPCQSTATPAPGATTPPPPPPPPASPTPTATAAAPGQGGPGDLALGRPIYASSTQPGYPPEWAVDGDPNSYWASQPGRHPFYRAQNIQWIYVDLGSDQQVTRMDVEWGANEHARGYSINVWSDFYRDWVTIGSTTRGDGDDEWTVRGDVELRGRYFMLWLVNPYLSGHHYEITSWEIHGPGSGASGANNLALGKTVVAEREAPGQAAANVTDGDTTSAWDSGGLPVWLYVDLDTPTAIDRAILRWESGRHATDYGLYAWNGSTWTGIVSRNSATGGDESVNFSSVTTRYVLLFANAGPAGTVGLREIELYESGGPSGGGGVPPGPPTPIPFSANDGQWRAPELGGDDAFMGPTLRRAPVLRGSLVLEGATTEDALDPHSARPDVPAPDRWLPETEAEEGSSLDPARLPVPNVNPVR